MWVQVLHSHTPCLSRISRLQTHWYPGFNVRGYSGSRIIDIQVHWCTGSALTDIQVAVPRMWVQVLHTHTLSFTDIHRFNGGAHNAHIVWGLSSTALFHFAVCLLRIRKQQEAVELFGLHLLCHNVSCWPARSRMVWCCSKRSKITWKDLGISSQSFAFLCLEIWSVCLGLFGAC